MQVQDVVSKAAADETFKRTLESDPVTTLSALAPLPLQSDVWIYRVVVASLGIVALSAIFGGITLAIYDKATPEGVIALGSTALGAIAGLLAPSPNR